MTLDVSQEHPLSLLESLLRIRRFEELPHDGVAAASCMTPGMITRASMRVELPSASAANSNVSSNQQGPTVRTSRPTQT